MSFTFCNENGTINRSAVRAAIRKEFRDRFNYFFVQNNYPKSHGQPLKLARTVIRKIRGEASSEQHTTFVNPRLQAEVETAYTAAERSEVNAAMNAMAAQPITARGNQLYKEFASKAGIVRERVHARTVERIRAEINRAA